MQPPAGRPQRAVEIIDPFDNDTLHDYGIRQGLHLGAGITRGFARHRQRVAVGLLDILSRDSATGSRRRLGSSERHQGAALAAFAGA